ncbi:hypothetical protein FLP41_00755 (plasmid) [Paracoccus marcusii]|uniref:hypothetical protein n=1 Tax=Paracoccus marcusii TaxID=59779 RepID=UPI002ED6196B|nr:hypothetical protein FLP41_00755 [Paracoccus marcusii]
MITTAPGTPGAAFGRRHGNAPLPHWRCALSLMHHDAISTIVFALQSEASGIGTGDTATCNAVIAGSSDSRAMRADVLP